MANFSDAYLITSNNEGKYSNDPTDPGGETYKGISRVAHPKWSGWEIIDNYKHRSNFPENMYTDTQLNNAIMAFYKSEYWDVHMLDSIESQFVANELYDTGVNMGISVAGRFLQRTLNLLNKNGSVYPDIEEDGKIGHGTLRTLDACMKYHGDKYIYKILNILQGARYIDIMTKSPTQEKYAYGWLNRVDFIRV